MYINGNKMMEFEASKAFSVIGKSKNGEPTTVSEEFISLYRMCNVYLDALNRYIKAKNRDGYWAVELSAEEMDQMKKSMKQKLINSVKKLLWLNTMSKEMGEDGFITKRIDLTSFAECHQVIADVQFTLSSFCTDVETAEAIAE